MADTHVLRFSLCQKCGLPAKIPGPVPDWQDEQSSRTAAALSHGAARRAHCDDHDQQNSLLEIPMER